jgi:hypothetical protein
VESALLAQPCECRKSTEVAGERVGTRAVGDENDYGQWRRLVGM